ncbi:hypothetical protein ACTFIZ_003541 [Dictyostelium cf. discoideum]
MINPYNKNGNNNNNNNITFKYLEPDKIDNGLECAICLEVLNDPVVESQCGQMFCRECINNAISVKPICPLCNQKASIGIVAKYVSNKLNEALVTCTLCNDGSSIKRGEYKSIHLDKQCKSQLCEGCGFKFTRSEFDHHIKFDCSMAIVNCSGQDVLCPFRSTKSEVSIHEINCYHLSLRTVLSDLIKSNKEKDEKIKKLENQLFFQQNTSGIGIGGGGGTVGNSDVLVNQQIKNQQFQLLQQQNILEQQTQQQVQQQYFLQQQQLLQQQRQHQLSQLNSYQDGLYRP